MLKNLMYLIDTNTFGLLVTLFTVTINKNGELILRFVAELGELCNIESFSPNAFVAVKKHEFQSNVDTKFVITTKGKVSSEKVVRARIFEEEENFEAFEISVLGKFKNLRRPQKPVRSKYALSAVLANALMHSQYNVNTIIKGDSQDVECFIINVDSNQYFNPPKEIGKLYYIERAVLKNIPLINFLDSNFFGEDWKKNSLNTMSEFFLNGDELLIPTINHSWEKEYIEGKSFPYMKFFSKIPTITEWENFLRLPLKLEVS